METKLKTVYGLKKIKDVDQTGEHWHLYELTTPAYIGQIVFRIEIPLD